MSEGSPKLKRMKCTFPASRIKKIIQRDDEIGKVTKDAPMLISRCLEMFIKKLVDESSTITQTKNSKTISPAHLKECLLSNSKFDFLHDIADGIPNIDTSVKKRSNTSDEEGEGKKKRVKKAPTKKKQDVSLPQESETVTKEAEKPEGMVPVSASIPVMFQSKKEEEEDYDNYDDL